MGEAGVTFALFFAAFAKKYFLLSLTATASFKFNYPIEWMPTRSGWSAHKKYQSSTLNKIGIASSFVCVVKWSSICFGESPV
jgi:hypothetical protein